MLHRDVPVGGILAHHLSPHDAAHDLLRGGIGTVEGADTQFAVLVGAPGPHSAIHGHSGGKALAGDHHGISHAVATLSLTGGIGSLAIPEGDVIGELGVDHAAIYGRIEPRQQSIRCQLVVEIG